MMYYLFVGESFYPAGGVDDFRGSLLTLEVAKRRGMGYVKYDSDDWAHIAIIENNKFVKIFECGDYTGLTSVSGLRWYSKDEVDIYEREREESRNRIDKLYEAGICT